MAREFDLDAPDLTKEFNHVSPPPPEKEAETPEPELELRPPGPVPPGMDQDPGPLVSPYLREEEPEQNLREHMLLSREFRRAARDGFER